MNTTSKYNTVDWKSLVTYDLSSPTGLRWNVDRRSGKYHNMVVVKKGDVAGYISAHSENTRALLNHGGSMWSCSRIIWILFNGHIEGDMEIDHIDGNHRNNAISNLRQVTHRINLQNQKLRSTNSSGKTGVSRCVTTNKQGRVYVYEMAYWQNQETGKRESKTFSVLKYGAEVARKLAEEFRDMMIQQAIEQGAGYTDRHVYNTSKESNKVT